MKKTIFFALFVSVVTLINAQSVNYKVTVVQESEVPAAVVSAQNGFFSGVTVNRWEKYTTTAKDKSKDRYVAIFLVEGQNTRARYTYQGKGISATTYYSGKKLPQAIQDAAAANYAGYTLLSGEMIKSLESGKSVFRIRLRKGVQKLVVYVDANGKEVSKDSLPSTVTEDEGVSE